MTSQQLSHALSWLAEAADQRTRLGLQRELVARPPGHERVIDLASNDYLGLARHPAVVAGAVHAVRAYGAGATGSRLVTGTTDLHLAFEAALAEFCHAPTALVFSSGYTANLAAVTALSGQGSLVVSAADNHASLVDACRLSGARVVVKHDDDLEGIASVVATRSEDRALIVTDAAFSVTGRLAPLAELHLIARRHGAALIVDEAHTLGVVGPQGAGACAAAGIAAEPDVVQTVTLSKALGSQGGAVLASACVREHLINTARTFIFDTGLAPPSVGAALAALPLVSERRLTALRINADLLRELLHCPPAQTGVIPLRIGDPARAAAVRDACAAGNVRVGCFRPPSVPPGKSCLRLTAHATLSTTDIQQAAATILIALDETS